MSQTNKTLPRGVYSRAAKQLGVSRIYISQVVAGEFSYTDRVMEIWATIDKCAEEINREKEERATAIDIIRSKYAA